MGNNLPNILMGTLLMAVALQPSLAASAPSISGELSSLEERLQVVEDEMARISLDYSQRRGLIGAAEARQRYEDAVYAFLIGNHEDAAMLFFSLVESDALPAAVLTRDSEWYLAECLFEMGNYSTALEAYRVIESQGRRHPFFEDAVIRMLEIHGISKDFEQVQSMFRTYFIDPGQPNYIEPNDLIRYTIGKVYYRRGADGYSRAKGVFSEVSPSSDYYSRARYFMGTILSAEGEYETAKDEFARAAEAEPNSADTREVQELSWLALARLNYETGDYVQATEYYQRLDSSSKYFADQLYELAWTYIKQERWAEALQAIEIFLIAFPEHRYTMQLQITQGHLHMKSEGYEKALVSYEMVVRQYGPVRARLGALSAERNSASQIFEQMQEEDLFTEHLGLPMYAVEMLVTDDEVARAVHATEELSRQRHELSATQEIIEEVQSALSNTDGSVGMYRTGYQGIQDIQEMSLGVRTEIVGAELDYLIETVSEDQRPELRLLREEFLLLGATSEDLQGAATVAAGRYDQRREEVHAVQAAAREVQEINAALREEVDALNNLLETAYMTDDDDEYVRILIEEVEMEIASSEQRLSVLQSTGVEDRLMSLVPEYVGDENLEEWVALAGDYSELHRLLGAYWRTIRTAERDELRSQIDDLWTRLTSVDQTARETRGRLEDTEAREMVMLRNRFESEQRLVDDTHDALAHTSSGAERLAANITQDEFGRLQEQFAETIMRADVGIVDVYWIRKTEVSDEATRLRQEQADRLDELDRRFQVLNQKLEN